MKLVDAVNVSEIESVSRILLKDNKQNRLYADIWKVGINFALRIGDLLNIKFDDLDLINNEISLVEQKTTKPRLIKINIAALTIIQQRRALYPNDIYLFQAHSNRAKKDSPVSTVSVSRVFKAAGDRLGLKINTHSMRKTRGAAMYQSGTPVAVIQKLFNHASEAVTLRYIGITQADISQTYDDLVL